MNCIIPRPAIVFIFEFGVFSPMTFSSGSESTDCGFSSQTLMLRSVTLGAHQASTPGTQSASDVSGGFDDLHLWKNICGIYIGKEKFIFGIIHI